VTGKGLYKLVGLALLLIFVSVLIASAAGWSQPVNVSGWVDYVDDSWLWIGQDGGQAAFWVQSDTTTGQESLWTSLRPAGQDWTTPINLSGWIDADRLTADYLSTGLAADGTAWALWSDQNLNQAGDNWWVRLAQSLPGGGWQIEMLSEWYETAIRSSELAIGPDGDLAAVWTACTVLSPDYDPTCHVRVRRRPAGTGQWEATEQVDQVWVQTGMNESQVLVGPGELTLVVWSEANPADATHFEWRVAARAYDPVGGWDASVSDLSNGWIKPDGGDWLAQSVMDGAGTAVVAWLAESGAATQAQYSVTRAASTGQWSLATKISPDSTGDLEMARLALGQNGTVAALWVEEGGLSRSLLANARDPGGTWGGAQDVSGPANALWFDDVHIWPDGTAVALWHIEDSVKPVGSQASLQWSARPVQGNWGDAGMAGRIGEDGGEINGAGLALSGTGKAAAVWAVYDDSQPANQQWTVLAALHRSNAGWDDPEILAQRQNLAWTWGPSVTAAPQGGLLAALYHPRRPSDADQSVWYVELDTLSTVYLPMLLKEG
jgi:hypothetical protein